MLDCEIIKNKRGMTLLEIIFVVIILSMIMFAGLPAFSKYRKHQSVKNAKKLVSKVLDTAKSYAISNKKDYYVIFISDKDLSGETIEIQSKINENGLVLRALNIASVSKTGYKVINNWIYLPKTVLFDSDSLPGVNINNIKIFDNVFVNKARYIKFERQSGKIINSSVDLKFCN